MILCKCRNIFTDLEIGLDWNVFQFFEGVHVCMKVLPKAQPGDVLVFVFAGHGCQVRKLLHFRIALAWHGLHFFNHFNMFQCVQCVDCMTGALTWR